MEEAGSPTPSEGNVSPRRRFLRKRGAGIINVPPPPEDHVDITEDDISDSESEEDGVDPVPDVETGRVTVKEALEGLFTSGTVSSSTKE